MRLKDCPEDHCRARVLIISCDRYVCRMSANERLPTLGSPAGNAQVATVENPCWTSTPRIGLFSTHADRLRASLDRRVRLQPPDRRTREGRRRRERHPHRQGRRREGLAAQAGPGAHDCPRRRHHRHHPPRPICADPDPDVLRFPRGRWAEILEKRGAQRFHRIPPQVGQLLAVAM